MTIPLLHLNGITNCLAQKIENTTKSSLEWVISVDDVGGAPEILEKDGVAVMYLAMWNDDNPYFARSHYFNVTAAAPTSSRPVTTASSTSVASSSKPSSSSTGSASAGAAITTSSSPGSSTSSAAGGGANNGASTTADPSFSSSGPSGAVIGGAVGGTLGGLAVVGALAFLLFRYRRNKQAQANGAVEVAGSHVESQGPGTGPGSPDGQYGQAAHTPQAVAANAALAGHYSPEKDQAYPAREGEKYHFGVPLKTPPPQWQSSPKVEQVAELDSVQPQELYSPPPPHHHHNN